MSQTNTIDDQYSPHYVMELADFLEEVHLADQKQKDIEQTSVWIEHDIQRLIDNRQYDTVRKLAYGALLKCMGTE